MRIETYPYRLALRVDEHQRDAIEQAAHLSGQTMSEWSRDVLGQAASEARVRAAVASLVRTPRPRRKAA